MNDRGSRKRRSGGRAGNLRRSGPAVDQMDWRLPVNTDRPTEPLDEDGVQAIHEGAMRILEEIGVEFLNEESQAIFKQAGCRVRGTNVRMGRDFVMEMVAKAPSQFTITPRNPARQIPIGGDHILFGAVSSPPSYWDLETGKLTGTREHCVNLFKLAQYFNCIHLTGGYPVEPVDIHPSVRHLDVGFDKLINLDKVVHAYSLGPRTRRRCDGNGAHRRGAERCGIRSHAADVHQHQLNLAAQARHSDDRWLSALHSPADRR